MTALISAYGKNGQLDRALQIFQVCGGDDPGGRGTIASALALAEAGCASCPPSQLSLSLTRPPPPPL
jgi:hypothetical protein